MRLSPWRRYLVLAYSLLLHVGGRKFLGACASAYVFFSVGHLVLVGLSVPSRAQDSFCVAGAIGNLNAYRLSWRIIDFRGTAPVQRSAAPPRPAISRVINVDYRWFPLYGRVNVGGSSLV